MRHRNSVLLEALSLFGLALVLVWGVRHAASPVSTQAWWLVPFSWVLAACLPDIMQRHAWISRNSLLGTEGNIFKEVLLPSILVFPAFGAIYLYYFTGSMIPPRGAALPEGWGGLLFYNIFYIGLSEELFFRGYLQRRLDGIWGRPFRLFGADWGWGLVLANLCFAVGHGVVDGSLERLNVFFPGLLFGILQARTGAVAAPVLFHGLSNMVLFTLRGWV